MKKLVLALAAVAMIATPVLADTTFYGSARVATFYTNDTLDNKDFDVALQTNSRFGMKATTGDVAGRIEIGLRNPGSDNYVRLVYGEVKLGGGTLLVGQTYTPYTKFSSQAVADDLGFTGFGALYDGRQPQIKFTHESGVYVAAIDNDQAGATEVVIPKLAIGYAGAAGDINYNAGFAYQTADVLGTDISSYLLYVCGDAKFGEIGVIYGLHYGQNLSEFGIGGRNATFTTDDATSFGGMIEAQMNGVAVGFGYVADEEDSGLETDNQMSFFINYTAQIAKGFTIVPEFSYIDYMDDAAGLDEGDEWALGAKWQMDF